MQGPRDRKSEIAPAIHHPDRCEPTPLWYTPRMSPGEHRVCLFAPSVFARPSEISPAAHAHGRVAGSSCLPAWTADRRQRSNGQTLRSWRPRGFHPSSPNARETSVRSWIPQPGVESALGRTDGKSHRRSIEWVVRASRRQYVPIPPAIPAKAVRAHHPPLTWADWINPRGETSVRCAGHQ